MREYSTQMEAARKGIVTKELEIVAKKRKNDSRRTYAARSRGQGGNLRK